MLTYLPQGSVALQGIKTCIPNRIKEKSKKVYIYAEQSLMPAHRNCYSICDVRESNSVQASTDQIWQSMAATHS